MVWQCKPGSICSARVMPEPSPPYFEELPAMSPLIFISNCPFTVSVVRFGAFFQSNPWSAIFRSNAFLSIRAFFAAQNAAV